MDETAELLRGVRDNGECKGGETALKELQKRRLIQPRWVAIFLFFAWSFDLVDESVSSLQQKTYTLFCIERTKFRSRGEAVGDGFDG